LSRFRWENFNVCTDFGLKILPSAIRTFQPYSQRTVPFRVEHFIRIASIASPYPNSSLPFLEMAEKLKKSRQRRKSNAASGSSTA